jgi:hypothetical protein
VLWILYRYYPSPHIADSIFVRCKQENRVCLLLVGDVGSGKPAQKQVASLMNELASGGDVDSLVFAGDNFINHGVADVNDVLWKERFHDVYNLPHIKNLPVFAILGNHDYAGNAKAQIEYSEVCPGRWNMPARHFSVSFGNVLELGCIDTNFPDRSGLGVLPLDKLDRRLRASSAPWKVVVGHRPLHSGGLYTSIQPHLRIILERFLSSVGASVYLSGHDHCQQHIPFKPMGGQRDVHQVVAGCGGSDLRNVELNHKNALYSANVHGVVRMVVTPDRLEVFFHVIGKKEPTHAFAVDR